MAKHHHNKEINKAIEYAISKGWRYESAKSVGISTGHSIVLWEHVRDIDSELPAPLGSLRTGQTVFEKKLMTANTAWSNEMNRVPFTLVLAGDELSESQMNDVIMATDSDAMPIVRSGRSFVAAWASDKFRQSVTTTLIKWRSAD